MQANDFYSGILYELRCIRKEAEGNTPAVPAIKPPAAAAPKAQAPVAGPSLSPSKPAPVPAAGAPAISGVNATPPIAPPIYRGVSTNLTGTFLPAIQKAYSKYPVSEWPQHLKQDAQALTPEGLRSNLSAWGKSLLPWGNSQDTKGAQGVSDYANNPLLSSGLKYLASNPKGYNDIMKFKDVATTLSQQSPKDFMTTVHNWGSEDPAVKKFYDTNSHRVVDETLNNAKGLGDLYNLATGPKNDWAQAAMEVDPELKDYATNQGLHRAGELSMDWLKNNWGKLAAGVGGTTALFYLIKSLMGEEEQPQPQYPAVQRRINAPQSF